MIKPMDKRFLFLVASTREPGVVGNTEMLAREAARYLPEATKMFWLHLARLKLSQFVDVRHQDGVYPMPQLADGNDMRTLLDATLEATDIVFVSPVYWYGLPAPLKTYVDHWSAWMRVPEIDFKGEMAKKSLSLITTSGDRQTSQPMIDSVALCAKFLKMNWRGELWGKGGAPGAVLADVEALASAQSYFASTI
jgi:multimeric flavodoxin WrbA